MTSIDDIQQTVHAIRAEVSHIREEQIRQDGRITLVEARQEGFEKAMAEEHRHIHEKFGALAEATGEIKQILLDHTAQEGKDRKALLAAVVSTLMSVLLGLGAWGLTTLHAMATKGAP